MLHRESNEIPIRKGVRQDDTISPKLFTASLEDLFRNLDWSNRGVSISGSKIYNLSLMMLLGLHDVHVS